MTGIRSKLRMKYSVVEQRATNDSRQSSRLRGRLYRMWLVSQAGFIGCGCMSHELLAGNPVDQWWAMEATIIKFWGSTCPSMKAVLYSQSIV